MDFGLLLTSFSLEYTFRLQVRYPPVRSGSSSDLKHLNGPLSLITIKRWCKKSHESEAIQRLTSPGRPRRIRTKQSIQKVNQRLIGKESFLAWKLALELNIFCTSVRWIPKNYLHRWSYKKVVEPLLKDEQKVKRKYFRIGSERIFVWRILWRLCSWTKNAQYWRKDSGVFLKKSAQLKNTELTTWNVENLKDIGLST